uniref:Reverse transcriptase domain-containing protein n=1 Tax=Strongyloides papillosus TaxID=174720 RepID=A0A0N5C001_STREA
MERWTEEELQIVEKILDQNSENLDYAKIKDEHFTKRTVPAIKKKILEIKKRKNNGTTARAATVWDKLESKKLLNAFVNTPGNLTKTQKCQLIQSDFPNRTIKAMQTHLRTHYLDIYMGYTTKVDESPEKNTSPIPRRPLSKIADQTPSTSKKKEITKKNVKVIDNKEPSLETSTIGSSETSMINNSKFDAQPPNPKEPKSQIEKIFLKYFNLVQTKKLKRLTKFVVQSFHQCKINAVSNLVKNKIASLEKEVKKLPRRHQLCKLAILAGGYTLKESCTKKNMAKKDKPSEILKRKISKLQARVKRTLRIQEGEKISLRLKSEIKEMKRLRMKPKQYISTTKHRIELLEKELAEAKERDEKWKLRFRAGNQPGLRNLNKFTKDDNSIDYIEAEKYFSELYSPFQPSTPETPYYNEWLNYIQDTCLTSEDENLSEAEIRHYVNQHLKTASNWKAGGWDQITNYLYKYIPAAKEYLIRHMTRIINGTYKLSRKDVQATCVLLHKGGSKEISNYRPLSLICTDIKCYTSIITQTIYDRLPSSIIPQEQLCQPKKWGTVEGLLRDKAYSGTARYRNVEQYSLWVDYRKAYDSICHKQMQRLINLLPIGPSMRNQLQHLTTILNTKLMDNESPNERQTISIKRGVMQGDVISPLLYILVSSSAVYQLKKNLPLKRLCKGNIQIITYMDDLKVFLPNESSLRAATELIEHSSAEIGLFLNSVKSGYFSRKNREDLEGFKIPKVVKYYKYLGILQTDHDVHENYEKLSEAVSKSVKKIFSSKLSFYQKCKLFNCSTIAAATYILGNITTKESVEATLAKARKLDLTIRKDLVSTNQKIRQVSNNRLYSYLCSVDSMKEPLQLLEQMQKGGLRTALSDWKYVKKLYKLPEPNFRSGLSYNEISKELISKVKKIDSDIKKKDWAKSMKYPQRVISTENIDFPGLKSLNLNTEHWRTLTAAGEEQLFLNAKCQSTNYNTKLEGKCRRCGELETSHHVVSMCKGHKYHQRHDIVIYHLLVKLAEKIKIQHSLQFGQATVSFKSEGVSIVAGAPYLSEKKLKFNRPDIICYLYDDGNNLKEIVVLEVAIPHLSQYVSSQKRKRIKYEVNSIDEVTDIEKPMRNLNLVSEIQNKEHRKTSLFILAIGTYGEVIYNEETNSTLHMLQEKFLMSNKEVQLLLTKMSYSVMCSSARILNSHLSDSHDRSYKNSSS